MSEEAKPTACAHCGRKLELNAGFGMVKGETVCHPQIPDGPDCYRLITVYGEEIGTRHPIIRLRDREEIVQKVVELEMQLREIAEAARVTPKAAKEAPWLLRERVAALADRAANAEAESQAIIDEVMSICDSFHIAPAEAPEFLYSLGRKTAMDWVKAAVERALGKGERNSTPYVAAPYLSDTKLIRLAINDPGSFVQRERLHDEEYESLGNWAARAVQVALREGRGNR